MGKVLVENVPLKGSILLQLSETVVALEEAFRACKLLWPKNKWEAQFAPHMFVPEEDSDILLE